MRSDVVRAEDAYLTEPEPADTDCPMCGGSPCICDATTEALMDELDWSGR